jgi:hypothetical protein
VAAVRLVPGILLLAFNGYSSPWLSPETRQGFDRYVQSAEAAMNRDIERGHFLEVDGNAGEKSKLRGGETGIHSCAMPDSDDIPGGMIQDWRGAMFIPHANIQQAKAALQDYNSYKLFYKPEVIESKELAHKGDDYDIFLRLRKRQVLTVVLNTEYHVHYHQSDPSHLYVLSRSTRLAEVEDPDRSLTDEAPVGHDSGFLWRLNSYWRFEEADGGLYAECRAISLSRDVPAAVGWMIKGFITKYPKESMQNTLRGTKAAIEHHFSRR